MKIVIFAGGVGTRLWPLSRKKSPKQFGKIIGDKSTLQETVERLLPQFKPLDIYIATGKRYKEIVTAQLPQIPQDNFIFEPTMRDVGPAIGLVTALLETKFPDEPMAILWSDHLVKNKERFTKSLLLAEKIINDKKAEFVFIAQKPRFVNQNIGWIELGDFVEGENETKIYKFKQLKYKPALDDAIKFFKNEKFVWNLGYFVTTPKFLFSLFRLFAPNMHGELIKLQKTWQDSDFEEKLQEIYPTLEKISFDNAILEKLSAEKILVVSSDLGWSDVGAWEALKEALGETKDENVTRGKVMLEDAKDSLVFNYTEQLTVGLDLEETIVINTEDVLLICKKSSVPKIKKLVENLAGTPHEHLT